MNLDEMRKKSIGELMLSICDLRKQLFKLRAQKALSPSGMKTHQLGSIKKVIAQMNTVIREKEAANG